MQRRGNPRAARTAALNDALRRSVRNPSPAVVLISAGIQAEGEEFRAMVLTAIERMTAKDFKKGNDPYGERDFNSFTIAAKLCLFKIDYFAKDDLRRPSEDPSDPGKTTRVMTIMLARDY